MGTSHERGTARIADLKEAPYNPRRISKEALAGLRASLDRWGLVQEIVVNRRTGHIVGGHQRVAAMRLAGEAEAPVVWVDLPMKEEKALNVALNNPHISGEFSDDLAAILEEVREHDAAMFEAVRLDALMEAVPTTPDLDPEPQMGGLEYRIVVDCESESHPRVDLVVESAVSCSFRVRQLEGMFDVPQAKTQRVEWHGNVPIDDDDWNVGLIVGPSGSGKSSVARQLFGDHVDVPLQWGSASVIDDFSKDASMEKIADVCRAVGFNTIPAWMRPFSVLSTGEKFRVELARRLLECQDPVVVDEFTSVVDRQVAKIGSHAVQKFLRKNGRRFVAVGCHYDVIDWLQPDWILEPATMTFQRRLVQRRPSVDVEIARVHHSAWSIFAPFHYMTAELNKAAQCFTLFVGDTPATFGAMLHRPHATTKNIVGLSRLVTLPDFQGLGLGLILPERLGAAYKATGRRMRTYPAHPSLIRSFDHSPAWAMVKRPGTHSSKSQGSLVGEMGGRPCAVFEYAGPPDEAAAKGLFDSEECHR